MLGQNLDGGSNLPVLQLFRDQKDLFCERGEKRLLGRRKKRLLPSLLRESVGGTEGSLSEKQYTI